MGRSFEGKWRESCDPLLVPKTRSVLRCHMSNSRHYPQELVSGSKSWQAGKSWSDRVVDPVSLKIGGQFGGEEASGF